MARSVKLSTRLGICFGMLIAVCAVLGGVGWWGVGRIHDMAELDRQGGTTLEHMNQCAAMRREFAAKGFVVTEGKTAADRFNEGYAKFKESVQSLAGDAGLEADEQALIATGETQAPAYEKAFEALVGARRGKDQAFEGWKVTGGKVTQDIQAAVQGTIAPAQAAAQAGGETAKVVKWAEIASQLDRDVVQTFLLLRVSAVHLLATNADAQWDAYQKQLDATTAAIQKWGALVKGEQTLEALAVSLTKSMEEYKKAGTQYHESLLAERSADAEMVRVAASLAENMRAMRAKLTDRMTTTTQQMTTIMVGFALGALALGVALTVLSTRAIVKPVRGVIASLNEGADQVSEASGQVANASQELASGASEQASSIEETSSALEEIASMTRVNADNAKKASDLSNTARVAADQSDQTMANLNHAMAGINESADKISKIIKVIEEIAFQTNLLALNAAVEAARAGEHGKGFAVVADEVRNLAQRAAQAARETTSLIADSVSRTRDGMKAAEEVGKALGGIVGNVTQISDLIAQIAEASQEQAQGVEQVNTAVSQMDQVTQENAAGAEESASAAEELSAQAVAVKGSVLDLVALVDGKAALQAQAHNNAASPKGINRSKPRAAARLRSTPQAHPTAAVQQTSVFKTSAKAISSDADFLALDSDEIKDF